MTPRVSHSISSDMDAFHQVLRSSKRILALCGAGLSAASGLPTFRGKGGLWRNHKATSLATPQAFAQDPGLVWLFYAYRRHMALRAAPNGGHQALAALGRRRDAVDFLCLTQNVDGLANRAGHPAESLRPLHGSLFDVKCSRWQEGCDWVERDNRADPFCPALAAAAQDVDPGQTLPLLDPAQPLAEIPVSELPKCPQCRVGLQRPGVVWFNEPLDDSVQDEAEDWINEDKVDLVLVVGTTAVVWPAALYVSMGKEAGARVALVNIEHDMGTVEREGLGEDDFSFVGDAAELLPKMLEPIIGPMNEDGTYER